MAVAGNKSSAKEQLTAVFEIMSELAHVQAQQVSPAGVLPALSLVLAVGHEEEVATDGDGGCIFYPRARPTRPVPGQPAVDDVTGPIPLIMPGPDPAFTQREQL